MMLAMLKSNAGACAASGAASGAASAAAATTANPVNETFVS
jgi:hypothetical protein